MFCKLCLPPLALAPHQKETHSLGLSSLVGIAGMRWGSAESGLPLTLSVLAPAPPKPPTSPSGHREKAEPLGVWHTLTGCS